MKMPRLPFRHPWSKRPPIVPVLRLEGVIGQAGGFRPGLSLAELTPLIDAAFRVKGAKAVALQINSPGGSPVQSALIAARIRQQAESRQIPVIAFCEDVAASGGYWLACAADEIHADASSIVGSIGVISASFGFTGLMERIGVERRVHTVGERKSILDPFQPQREEDVALLHGIQQDIYENFRTLVRDRRGARLKAPDEELFSGAFWSGRRAMEMGLIDGIGHIRPVLQQRYGETVRLPVLRKRRSPLRNWLRRFGGTDVDGAALTQHAVTGLVAGVEERAHWSRFGL